MSETKIHGGLVQYLDLLNNTGGNDPKELLSRHVPPGSNDILAAMQISVASQIALLRSLKEAGLLLPKEMPVRKLMKTLRSAESIINDCEDLDGRDTTLYKEPLQHLRSAIYVLGK